MEELTSRRDALLRAANDLARPQSEGYAPFYPSHATPVQSAAALFPNVSPTAGEFRAPDDEDDGPPHPFELHLGKELPIEIWPDVPLAGLDFDAWDADGNPLFDDPVENLYEDDDDDDVVGLPVSRFTGGNDA
jgi:hypothetical protein